MTPEDYDRLLKAQKGRCAICRAKSGYRNGGNLHVDHCHETGMVRGLLCLKCNRAIGLLEEPRLLRKAARYLEKTAA